MSKSISRIETQKLLALAIPVILAQVGGMTLNLVDTWVVGRFSTEELSGVAAGNSIFGPIFVIGTGLLLGVDPLIARLRAKSDGQGISDVLRQSILLSLAVACLLGPLVYNGDLLFSLIGATDVVSQKAQPYIQTLAISLPFALVFYSYQRFWQALQSPFVVTWIVILSNFVNLLLDLMFVPGFGPIPAYGAKGAGYATLGCRIFQLLAIIVASRYLANRQQEFPLPNIASYFSINLQRLKQLLTIGLPACGQLALEVIAFNVGTFIAAKLGVVQLASHHIIFSMVAFTFMFPLGISIASAIRVSHHYNRKNFEAASLTGNIGIFLAAGIMALFALVFISIPETLISMFTKEEKVVAAALDVIVLCALFQIMDGVQVAAAGVLRGLENTKISLLTNLLGFYFIGLPLAIYLAFTKDLELIGLWIGIAISIVITSILNTFYWRKLIRKKL
ncbi:MAG: MATE family efflux transporter [Pseudobacteriovorax sp.]|nr:MATE family efflux transporter [Pseudobacteriovorax sp.]